MIQGEGEKIVLEVKRNFTEELEQGHSHNSRMCLCFFFLFLNLANKPWPFRGPAKQTT